MPGEHAGHPQTASQLYRNRKHDLCRKAEALKKTTDLPVSSWALATKRLATNACSGQPTTLSEHAGHPRNADLLNDGP